MCKIHTISESNRISREIRLKEGLQYLTKKQLLYWNVVGQN